MCTTCGCGAGETRIDGAEHEDEHGHEHVHADGTVHSHSHGQAHEHAASGHVYRPLAGHTHHDLAQPHGDHIHFGSGAAGANAPGLSQSRMVQIEQDILGKNNTYAAENRRQFAARGVLALNLVSSPGSGKTTLLCRTIEMLNGRLPIAVVEGDQQTSQDAERIRATGARAVQINTGKGCHLDAHRVGHALKSLAPDDNSVLMIENVGNLVCPAAFDLGEAHKVVILSVTEGEDKPIKYPDMFRAAGLMLLNKCDLLPYLSYDVDKAIDFARRVNPGLRVIRTSATSGEGMAEWLNWIEAGLAAQGQGQAQAAVA